MIKKTIATAEGISTSITKDGVKYLIATAFRPEVLGVYQTVIAEHPSMRTVYRIEVKSQLQSVQEHVDTVKMVIERDERQWDGTKPYQGEISTIIDKVQEDLNSIPGATLEQYAINMQIEMPWTDARIKSLLLRADINFKDGFFAKWL